VAYSLCDPLFEDPHFLAIHSFNDPYFDRTALVLSDPPFEESLLEQSTPLDDPPLFHYLPFFELFAII
jgi:hypothetical protein